MSMQLGEPVVRELLALQKLCEEKGVDKSIKESVSKALELTMGRYDYSSGITSDESEPLASVAKETASFPFKQAFEDGKTSWSMRPMMMSGKIAGKLLQSLLGMSKAKRVLEVGMFTGYGALACAEAIPADGEVVTCELETYIAEVAKTLYSKSPHGKKISVRLGPAKDSLLALADEKKQFDLVFVDANKDGYKEYYQIIMDRGLLAENGTIVFDNALHRGIPYSTNVDVTDERNKGGLAIKEFNEILKSQDSIHRVMLPILDGVLIVRRKNETLTDA